MLVMAAIVPLLVLSVVKTVWQTDAALKRATNNLEFLASLVAANQDRVTESARHLLESVAVGMAQPGMSADCYLYFKALKDRLPQYANIGIAGLDGYTYCDGVSKDKSVYIGDRGYFTQAVESGEFSSSGYTVGRISGKALMMFALPVKSASGAITAVAFVGLDIKSLVPQSVSIPVPQGGRVLVTDRDGRVLALNPARPDMIGSLVESSMLQTMVKSRRRGVEVSLDSSETSLIYAFQPAGDPKTSPFYVVVSADRDKVVGPAQRDLMVELGALAAMALIGGLLAWLLGGYAIVRPANRILAAILRLQRGERDVRISVPRHQVSDDFSRIADGFNLMADSLGQREDALNTELFRSRHAYDTLQLTINSMQEGMIAVDTVGRVLLFNQAAATMFLMDGAPLVLSGEWSRHHGLYMPGADNLLSTANLPLAKALSGTSGSAQHICVRNVLHPQGRLISASFHPMMSDKAKNGESGVIGALMVFADITRLQQMQMEQAKGFIALQETQRRLTDAQRVGRMGNWELNLSTHEFSFSDEIHDLYGLTPASFDGKFQSLVDMMHPDDRERFDALRRSARELCSAMDIEYRVITPAGQTRWLRQQCAARTDAKGQNTLRVGVIQDITDRKLAELTLADSYSKLGQAQEKLLDAQRIGRFSSWEFDLQTQVFSVSREYHELCGIPDTGAPLNRQEFLLLIHPDDRPGYLQALAHAEHMTPNTHFEADYRLITPTGDLHWVRQVMRLERNAQGKVIRRFGVMQDVTESKLAKLSLADTVDRLNRTGELAKIGGWELDLDTRRLLYSDQVRRIHEMEDGEEHTPEVACMAHPEDVRQRFVDATTAAAETGEPWDMELPMITRKGRRIWVRAQGRAMRENGKIKRLVGTLQDITEQYQSRKLLRLLQTSMDRLTDVVMVSEAEPQPGVSERAVVYANEAFERFSGYTLDDVRGKVMTRFSGPLTSQQSIRELTDALKAQRSYRTELVCYKKSGEAAWIELDIVPIFDYSASVSHWVWVARDLTSRKAAEQELLHSEQRYMALFEAAPLPLWVFDEKTLQFLTVNVAAIEYYGFSREEFLAMTVLDIRHERERPWARAHLSKLPSGEAFLAMHRKKNGQEFPVQVVARSISFEGKAGQFVVALDISARVKAEKDVQDQMFTLQRAADAAQAITSHQTLKAALQEVADQARGVIGAHQALVMLTEAGAAVPSIYGLSLSEKYANYRTLSDPVDGSGIYALVSETNRPIRLTQAELVAHPRWKGFGTYADKHPAMRGWLAVPLMGRDGKSMGVLQLSDKFEGEFTLQDEYVVTELAQLAATALENARLFDEINRLNLGLEQKVADRTEALSRQEALFRALADEAPQAIWTITAQSEVTYLNRAFLALVGGDTFQWLGKAWLTLVHPEDLPELLRTWEIAIAQRARYANIRRMRAATGQWHIMSCTASPVFNESGEVEFWVGIDSDITEIKATEAALRLSNQELEAFSYSVSHDLRSPLNTIDGFSRLLSKQVSTSTNEKTHHYLARIQAGVAQMGQLIEDLLSLAQVSRMQLRIEKVDLSALSEKILDDCCVCAPDRVVTIRIQAGLVAFGDIRLLRVVMENLLGNAWKFTSHRSVGEISVTMTPETDGDPVFVVSDNGAGFDMAYADKLFTAFQRLHGVQEFPGSGIGLATVSRVITRHGGKLWTHAAVDQGAQFYFTLPHSLPPR